MLPKAIASFLGCSGFRLLQFFLFLWGGFCCFFGLFLCLWFWGFFCFFWVFIGLVLWGGGFWGLFCFVWVEGFLLVFGLLFFWLVWFRSFVFFVFYFFSFLSNIWLVAVTQCSVSYRILQEGWTLWCVGLFLSRAELLTIRVSGLLQSFNITQILSALPVHPSPIFHIYSYSYCCGNENKPTQEYRKPLEMSLPCFHFWKGCMGKDCSWNPVRHKNRHLLLSTCSLSGLLSSGMIDCVCN